MNAATERITEMLRSRDWNFEVEEDSELVKTGFQGRNAQWRITIGSINDCAVVILSKFPVDCPEPKRQVCAEILTRISYGMALGGFEFDYSDGTIFFKTSVPYNEELPQTEMLDLLLSANLQAMDHFLPAIMSVIYAGISPTKALADLEKADAKTKNKKTKPSQPKLTGPSRFQMN